MLTQPLYNRKRSAKTSKHSKTSGNPPDTTCATNTDSVLPQLSSPLTFIFDYYTNCSVGGSPKGKNLWDLLVVHSSVQDSSTPTNECHLSLLRPQHYRRNVYLLHYETPHNSIPHQNQQKQSFCPSKIKRRCQLRVPENMRK